MKRVHPVLAMAVVLCLMAGARAAPAADEAADIEARLQAYTRARRERNRETVPLLERLLHLREASLGPDHLEVATCLLRLGRAYRFAGGYPLDQAERLVQRALRIREARLGPGSPDVAGALDELGLIRVTRGNVREAEAPLRRSLAIREAALGRDHPQVATSLEWLGWYAEEMGDLKEARASLERALRLRQAALGPRHPDVAETLFDLGSIWLVSGDNQRARELDEQALQIWEAAFGPDAFEVGVALRGLGWLHREMGEFAAAERSSTRALAVLQKALGPVHLEVAISYRDLGELCADQGRYRCAEESYHQALGVARQVLPQDHPLVPIVLGELADVYQRQGLFDKALDLLGQALHLDEVHYGARHYRLVYVLGKLAQVHGATGQYDKAEELQRRMLEIARIAMGPENQAVASALRELARIRRLRGAPAEAESHLRHALAIYQRDLGDEHPTAAQIRYELGQVAQDQGDLAGAAGLYRRSLAILEKALGPDAPQVSAPLTGLARVLAAQGRIGEAVGLLRRALGISEDRLRKEALAASEKRLGGLLELLREQEGAVYDLLAAHPASPEVRRLALLTALLHKGRSLDQMAALSHAICHSVSEQDRAQLDVLRGLRSRIAGLALSGPGARGAAGLARFRQELDGLEQRAEAAEADLAQRSAVLRQRLERAPSGDIIAQVAAALPRDGLLLELVQAKVRPLAATDAAPPTLRYLALTLTPAGRIGARDLGPAGPVDALANEFLHAAQDPDRDPAPAGRALYQQVLAPLGAPLAAARALYLSPDGALGLVPFSALPGPEGALLERYRVSYLTSGRDLLARTAEARPAGEAVIFADPALATVPPPSPRAGNEVTRSFVLDGLGPLPGAREEAAALHAMLPGARVLLGADASEGALLSLHAPGLLHLATHGVVLEDEGPPLPHGRGFGRTTGPAPGNPLLRSALVMAGAVALSRRDAGAAGQGDGLATALEIAGMDLWGTQLVVLSACDLGKGQVLRGDGVHGMRRAVMIAGAETLVSSLWKVNDQATRDLMVAFYGRLLAGEDRVEALRQAKLAVRSSKPHPYYWAAFILVGRGGPLRKLPGRL